MAGGIVRRVRPGPNQPLRVNASHPLAAGLGLFGWAIGVNRIWDALTGRVIDLSAAGSATGTFLRGAGDNGPTLRMSGGERGGGTIYNPTGVTLGQGTLVARFRPAQAIAAGVTRPYVLIGDATLNRGLLLGMSGSTSSHAYGVSNNNGWQLLGGNGVDEQVWRTVGVTVDPTSVSRVLGWLDGRFHGNATIPGSGISSDVSSRIWFGRDNVGYFGYPTGDVGWFGYWHRLLGAGEHRLLHEDPWSLVTPASQVQGWRLAAAAGGSDTTLAGAATGAGTAAGALTTAIRLAGAGVGAGAASGALSTGIRLAGAGAGAGAASGALTTAIRLAATPTATGTATGALAAGAAALQGAASGTGTASAALTTAIQLAGAATGSGAASASLSVGGGLEAAASGTGTAAGTLSTGIRLAGSASGAGLAAGDLSTGIRLAAAVSGAGTAAGGLSTGIVLSGAVSGAGTALGALSTGIRLAGAMVGSGTAAAALTAGTPVAADPRRTARLLMPLAWPAIVSRPAPRVLMGRTPLA